MDENLIFLRKSNSNLEIDSKYYRINSMKFDNQCNLCQYQHV